MAKRVHSDNDSEPDRSTTSSGKRQRTQDGSPARSTPPAQDGDFDPDASDEEEDDDDEEEDEEIRRQAEELRATQAGKTSKVAEAGVITQVEVQNFMCHAATTVNFGPQVNFLVGVNGSGKSAILTGITMALGGNAKSTNRGQKGGDLIQEGKSSAKCIVTLSNKGDEAYKHHIYGDKIIIERTLNKTGSGAYKIKSAEGLTRDTKKATLDEILDQFNIQVDNPMTVLTQDQSRQFLASASPKDKYTFFLRGTQLAQLTQEYELLRANTEQMQDVHNRKAELLPDIKEKYRKAKERAKEAKAAAAQQDNLQKLKDEMTWAYVAQVEKQIAFGEEHLEKEAAKLPDLAADIAKWQAQVDEAEAQVVQLREAEAEGKQTIDAKQPRLDDLTQLLAAERDRIKRWKDSERTLNQTVQRIQHAIYTFEQQIADEERKLSRDIEAERRPIREAKERADQEVQKLGIKMLDDRRTADETTEQLQAVGEEYRELGVQLENAHRLEGDAQGRLNHIRLSANNPLARYGPRAEFIKKAVDQERRWREKPIGPVGMYLKLEQMEYARMLESFFGPTLNAWVVTNFEDQRLLRDIFNRIGQIDKNTPILRTQFDPSFEGDLAMKNNVDPNILTILRALTFEHPLIRQTLVINRGIEKCALVPQRPDGDRLMRSHPRNIDAAYSADRYKLSIRDNKSSAQNMPDWKGGSRLQKDVKAAIQTAEYDLNRIRSDVAGLQNRRTEVMNRGGELKRREKDATALMHQNQKRIRDLNRISADADAKLKEEQPNNIAALQENKKEAEAELQDAQAQYQAGKETFERESQNNEPLAKEKRDVENSIRKAEKLQNQVIDYIQKEYGKISQAKAFQNSLEHDRAKLEQTLKTYEEEIERTKATLEERIELASTVCARPDVEKWRDPKRLQREVEGLEKALKQREKEQGGTIDEILARLDKARATAAHAVQQTNDLAKLIKTLSNAYEARVLRWTDFRDHIGQRAKMQFLNHLSNRGFTGKLKFDHAHSKLSILVQTEEGDKKQKKKQKDTKSLSGGEKSFSTICLLLTMWEAVGCPIRCLDEFDVFMDAVNRRIAMKMMVDTAKTADKTQHVLITPQETSNVPWGPEVKVIKLADPARGSGALAAGA
ncbi:hypothetical protein JCM10207_005133 [Rhodosporidiobolus poonsookiae]